MDDRAKWERIVSEATYIKSMSESLFLIKKHRELFEEKREKVEYPVFVVFYTTRFGRKKIRIIETIEVYIDLSDYQRNGLRRLRKEYEKKHNIHSLIHYDTSMKGYVERNNKDKGE